MCRVRFEQLLSTTHGGNATLGAAKNLRHAGLLVGAARKRLLILDSSLVAWCGSTALTP